MSVEAYSMDTANSIPLLITDPVGTNAKGGYTQLIASTGFATKALMIYPYGTSALADFLFDISTGGAGSESVVLADIPVSTSNTINSNNAYGASVFPIAIASGTRVAARFQVTSLSAHLRLGVYGIAEDTVPFANCTSSVTYGTTAASSRGTTIDAGGTANTKPATFTTIAASTSADHQWFVIGCNNLANTARTNAGWLVDIATGAASSETVIIPNLVFSASSGMNCTYPFCSPPIPIAVSSGTRISARAQCTTNDATDRLISLTVIGFSGTASAGGASPSFSAYIA